MDTAGCGRYVQIHFKSIDFKLTVEDEKIREKITLHTWSNRSDV